MSSLRSRGSRLRWKQNISSILPCILVSYVVSNGSVWTSSVTCKYFSGNHSFKQGQRIFFLKGQEELCWNNILVEEENYTEKLHAWSKKRQPTTDHCHGKNLLRQQRKIVYESFNMQIWCPLYLYHCARAYLATSTHARCMHNPKSQILLTQY